MQIHDSSLSWFGTGTSKNVAGSNSFYGPKPPLLAKCCGHTKASHRKWKSRHLTVNFVFHFNLSDTDTHINMKNFGAFSIFKKYLSMG
jgi:hypothetical protein